MSNKKYILVETDEFKESLSEFDKKTQKKIMKKCVYFLTLNPYRYKMVVGSKFRGIRRMKIGIKNYKSGARILYMIGEECRKNGYGIDCKKCKKECNHVFLIKALIRDNSTYR